ncbi:MAG: acetyl-CoA carboxylase biotin carboxyl carrier protein [Eubacteriaceae bacterium]|jgi:acetyl-CoA carboxylase biotin carboxyl carrier protein|nr:acetyl-CoA carboxylase biotin carboxyl carrier protein [Eubacteriaceae bacterium]
MDLKELESLIRLFDSLSLSELALKQGDFELNLKKEKQRTQDLGMIPAMVRESTNNTAEPSTDDNQTSGHIVKAPMVGVFYEAPSPKSPPFIKIGDQIAKGQVLCIIEAMKMINEVVSPVSGVVKEIFIANGELVEYDTPLIEIEVTGV